MFLMNFSQVPQTVQLPSKKTDKNLNKKVQWTYLLGLEDDDNNININNNDPYSNIKDHLQREEDLRVTEGDPITIPALDIVILKQQQQQE